MAKIKESIENNEAETCSCKIGGECNCGEECSCGCGCGCKCKKKVLVLIAFLVVFLAGMGFDSLLRGCGGCPSKAPRPQIQAQFPAPIPSFSDGRGNNIIIINTDGNKGMPEFLGQPNPHNYPQMKKDCPKRDAHKNMEKELHRRHSKLEEAPKSVAEPVNGNVVK